ncbi:MAG: hypothetical protein OQJ84_10640 [Xanthomonadales bacterium]|nr:hypothetical protein [Xanthomonadales bacterium]
MWRQTTGVLAIFSLVLAGPVTAEEVSIDGEVVDETPLARVVTGDPSPFECLAPVVIDRFDGEDRAFPAQGFSIEAGLHHLNGKALLDTKKCRPLEADQYIPPAADLSMEFVAGNIYYIAYDRSHPDTREWRLVVWKVEQQVTTEPEGQPAAGSIQ